MRADRKKVEILMAAKQLNPKDVITIAEISFPTLYRAYAGKSKPATLGRIAKALGVDVVDILETEVKP